MSLEELATKYKRSMVMREVISGYLIEKFPQHFKEKSSWKDVTATLPILAKDAEMRRLVGTCSEEYLKTLLRKVQANDPIPAGLASRLNFLMAGKFNVSLRTRSVQFHAVLSNDLLQTTFPKLDDESIFYPLTIIDFGRRTQKSWSVVQLKSFFQLAFDSSTSETTVMAIFIPPSSSMFYKLQTALRSFLGH